MNSEVSALAYNKEFALKCGGVRTILPATDEKLSYHGLFRFDAESQACVVCRYVAPTKHFLPFLVGHQLKGEFALLLGRVILWHEYHANRVLSRGRQFETELFSFRAHQAVGNLYQDSGPISG